jgi:MFS family permease
MASMAAIDPFYRIVWPLAMAEMIVWAAVYYSFPALLLEWERDLGWSKTELSGAFTLALVMSALLAPLVGRVIDRGYGLRVFTGCALASAGLLALLAGVTTLWQFYVVWLSLGMAMAGMLYEACFAVLTWAMGSRRKQAITLVTLVAGFAGTLAFPGTHALVGIVGWRGTMRVLAATVALIAVPLIWFGCRAAAEHRQRQTSVAGRQAVETLHIWHSATFWLLAVGFVAIALDHGVLLTHLLPLLNERSIPAGTAVLAASMIGPMQVVGRLAMMATERHVSTLHIFAACFVALGLAAISLLKSNAFPVLLFSFVLFQGAGYGATSIMRPVAVAEFLGHENFGLIAGFLAVPFLGAAAAAPTVAAFIWRAGGYDTVIWFAGGASVLGLISLLAAGILATRTRN